VLSPVHAHEGSGRTHSMNRLSIQARLPVDVVSVTPGFMSIVCAVQAERMTLIDRNGREVKVTDRPHYVSLAC
jgi:UDP-N-acetylglucosamine enolpyruvyl transferase